MITPASLNMTIYQGATFYKRFTWKENRRDPIDITGYTFRMQVRPSTDSTEVIEEFSSATGEFYLEDAANGVFVLEIPHTETKLMDFDRGVYDIECTYFNGKVGRIMQGEICLSRGITR